MKSVTGLILAPEDNVAILALSAGKPGQKLRTDSGENLKLFETVPLGHKIARVPIKAGMLVIKCGQVIGTASRNIAPGGHVHVHNLEFSPRLRSSLGKILPEDVDPSGLPAVFQGYLRKDGRAGIRNYIVVAATVNCSASVVKAVTRYFDGRSLPKGIDRIVPITHAGGCAQSVGGYSMQWLNRALAGWIDHPNVVGAVVIGLGCEVVRPETLFPAGKGSRIPIVFLDIQNQGGTSKSIAKGIGLVEKILRALPVLKRTRLPVSLLTLAAKCGGSDAFSALTANPVLGVTSDILVALGGTAAMGEIPECWGARENLLLRCSRNADRQKLKKICSWWLAYCKKNKVSVNDNISPGNIEGGISTIFEKSLGAAVKGGTSRVTQVVDFGERISRKGLVLMNTPGFDPVAMTGLVAGGCNLAAFTTGRGSVYGCSIVPTLKIATNADVFESMREDMDFDASTVLSGESFVHAGQRLFKLLAETASGRMAKSEKLKLGDEEFASWSVGETL